jgi:hypothetical protein
MLIWWINLINYFDKSGLKQLKDQIKEAHNVYTEK